MVNAYVKTLKWTHTRSAEESTDKMPADYAGNRALDATALKTQLDMCSPDGKMPPGGAKFVLGVEQKFNDRVTGKHVDLSKTYDNTFAAKANM